MIDEVHESDLRSWRQLNAVLKEASEDACGKLLEMEVAGQARLQFLNRIHGAFNKRRYERERLQLAAKAKGA